LKTFNPFNLERNDHRIIEFTGFGLDSNLLPTFLNLSKSRYGKNFSSVENAAFRQGTMHHMHRVHMVHMVHVMDVVLHIDRHRSRHGNFHRNLYNMRYDRHILFLATTQAKTSSTFPRSFLIFLACVASIQFVHCGLILACPACMDTAPFLFFQRPLRMPLVETLDSLRSTALYSFSKSDPPSSHLHSRKVPADRIHDVNVHLLFK
jgi:hypothetical protein